MEDQSKQSRGSRKNTKSVRSESVFEPFLTKDFFLTTKENKLPEVKILRKSEWFYICLSADRNQLIKFYCELWDNYIFLRQTKEKPVTAFMDINWARIKLLMEDEVDGKRVNVIKFSKFKSYEELFHEDMAVIMDWFEELKHTCVLSRFRVYFKSEKVLGKGNFAKVFLVSRNSDDKKFAVKVFDKKLILSDDLERKCLLYELKMMRAVNHKNVMRLLELYEGENYIYCLCELFEGGHLLDYIIKHGHFCETESLRLIKQLLEGLAYLESISVIHRDIKPENILFREKDSASQIAFVDLGFATYTADYNKLFTRCGTPGYVAPEVLHDKPYNCKADIFSAGIILYILLTGNVPFHSKNYEGLVQANMAGEVDMDFAKQGHSFSLSTINLLKRMLEIKAENRPFASDLLRDQVFEQNINDVDSHLTEEEADRANYELQQFHTKYNFNIKTFPKSAEIPDNLDELASPVQSPMVRFKSKDNGPQFSIFCKQLEKYT